MYFIRNNFRLDYEHQAVKQSNSPSVFSSLMNRLHNHLIKSCFSPVQVIQCACSPLRRAGSGFLGLLMACMTLPAVAGNMGNEPASHPWSVTGSLGYTVYKNMYRDDGQTALGRFAIGRDVFTRQFLTWGLEVGVQSGNTMRYFPSQAAIDALGGLPIQTTTKPMLDALVTLNTAALGTTPILAQLKGGLAYRRWQFNDRNSIGDKSQIAGEVQAGLGCFISDRASVSLSYQGIFGSHPDFHFNVGTATGRVFNIPVQNGVLLGLTLSV